jgi:hypothetical protein
MLLVQFSALGNYPLVGDLPGYVDDHLLLFSQEIVHITLLFTT